MRASGIAIFVLLFLFVGCSPETPEGLTAKAEKAYASKDYPRAIAAYEALLQIVGEEPTVYRISLWRHMVRRIPPRRVKRQSTALRSRRIPRRRTLVANCWA